MRIDSIVVNDSYFGFEFLSREKRFLNIDRVENMKVRKTVVKDRLVQNDPQFLFWLEMTPIGKSYERTVYSINDMLGNVGGIVGILL